MDSTAIHSYRNRQLLAQYEFVRSVDVHDDVVVDAVSPALVDWFSSKSDVRRGLSGRLSEGGFATGSEGVELGQFCADHRSQLEFRQGRL